MDKASIAAQARERARIALEQAQLAKQEAQEQSKQKEAQRARDDYPDLLRAKVISGLTVENSGNYAEDLAAFQGHMRDVVNTIPSELLLAANCDSLSKLLRATVGMLGLKPEIPAHMLEGKSSEKDLEPYIEQVLVRNLRARTFAALLAEPELRGRVFATCAPAPIEARLNTLAAEVVKVDAEKLEPEVFKTACRELWVKLFDRVVLANETGYVQSGGSQLAQNIGHWDTPIAWSASRWGSSLDSIDLPHLLATHHWSVRKEQGEGDEAKWQSILVINALKPMLDVLRPFAAKLEKLSAKTRKSLCKPGETSWLGWAIARVETIGIWSTNQCVCCSKSLLGLNLPVVNAVLQFISEYSETSPVVAAVVLQMLDSRIGSGWFYNCPDESMCDNSKEPSLFLELLAQDRCKQVFLGQERKDLNWIETQFERLLAEACSHYEWRSGWSLRYEWSLYSRPEAIVEIWDKHRLDDGYWERKKKQAQRAS